MSRAEALTDLASDAAQAEGDPRSLQDLQQAVESDPQDLEARHALALRLFAAGRHPEAVEAGLALVRKDRWVAAAGGQSGIVRGLQGAIYMATHGRTGASIVPSPAGWYPPLPCGWVERYVCIAAEAGCLQGAGGWGAGRKYLCTTRAGQHCHVFATTITPNLHAAAVR